MKLKSLPRIHPGILERQRTPPIRRRGLPSLLKEKSEEEKRAVEESWIKGTLPERIVFKALLIRGMKPGRDFDFQSSLDGGRKELGGMVVDFIIYTLPPIALRIQGDYFHGLPAAILKDAKQRSRLEQLGFEVRDLQEWECYSQTVLEDRLDRWLIGA
jgi:hypothetical protein